MAAEQQQQKKIQNPLNKTKAVKKTNNKQQDKGKKGPAFTNQEGKLGDTKQWINKT